jgi:alkylation response protein AidB-like acyl-CoA dehydrogenase
MSTPDKVAAEITAWLRESWDADLGLLDWRERLVESGWMVPSWPVADHGRGLPAWADAVAHDALRSVGAVGAPVGAGMSLAAPTIRAHADASLRAQVLRGTLTGALTWCQLFSEPSAGSDLAGLRAHAVRDGDEWVVNGQKVWNTSAHHADLGLLLARTDSDVPKHRGITCFVLPMRQPGVEVRPLRQMNGHASFNEVFLTDARIPATHVIGTVNDGWRVALTTLAHERRFGAMGRPRFAATTGRATEEAQREADEHFAVYAWYPQRAGRVDLLTDANDDPIDRQQIISAQIMQRVAGWTSSRAVAARSSGIARAAAEAHARVTGAAGMLTGPTTAAGGAIAEVLVSVPAQSIAGGTDEIQRNILGERVLGLPPEPSVDRDRPFREVT